MLMHFFMNKFVALQLPVLACNISCYSYKSLSDSKVGDQEEEWRKGDRERGRRVEKQDRRREWEDVETGKRVQDSEERGGYMEMYA